MKTAWGKNEVNYGRVLSGIASVREADTLEQTLKAWI
jgi:hypothetical protein